MRVSCSNSRVTRRALNFARTAPCRAARFLPGGVYLNPRLGRFRPILAPVLLYLVLAAALTYVCAPLRGMTGRVWMSKAHDYANERSLGTAEQYVLTAAVNQPIILPTGASGRTPSGSAPGGASAGSGRATAPTLC